MSRIRCIWTLVVAWAIALAMPATGSLASAPGGIAGPAVQNCAWTVHFDASVMNVAFPDLTAGYWGLQLPAVPGETLTIHGDYPHGRYMSLTAYDDQLNSADGLNDVSIGPDPGSSDPFLPGADRTVSARGYTVTVVFGQRPANAPPNTLYTTSTDGSRAGTHFSLLYRLYEPDGNLTQMAETGGVQLPAVTANLPGGAHVAVPNCPTASVPPNGVNATVTNASVPYPRQSANSGSPVWHKFVNYETSVAGWIVPQTTSLPHGGFLDNPDNKYIADLQTFNNGAVVAFWARLPTTPATVDGEKRMDAKVDMRYWSFCSNEIPTTRVWACLRDDQVRTYDKAGDFVIVVSQAADRPSNATTACGMNWLSAGPSVDTLLILRNMLPDTSTFPYSVQTAQYGSEQPDMGPYYPVGRYYKAAQDFEQLGCAPPAAP